MVREESKNVIMHVDMDAFFASVELHDHPEFRGQPLVVGSAPDQRGVISAASYEARKYGIHSAMPSSEAYRRCPAAIFRPVNMKRYLDVSRQIFSLFESFTPFVEPLSCDEAFLDVRGVLHLFGPPESIAQQIKQKVRAETGLTASIGVACNKFLAKLASDLDKPDGLTVVPVDPVEIETFLAPLSVRRIWGVGRVMGDVLNRNGIHTIGDLQRWTSEQLVQIVGELSARHLSDLAYGRDSRNLALDASEKSISREYTFPEDCTDMDRVYEVLRDLCSDVGRRLRQKQLYATGVQVKIRWEGFTSETRQKRIEQPCSDDFTLYEHAKELMTRLDFGKPVRLVGVGANRLSEHAVQQLSLFDDVKSAEKRQKISKTVDEIRKNYGNDSIGMI